MRCRGSFASIISGVALLALSLCGAASAQIFVDVDAPAGGNGDAWASAYNTVHEAMAEAVPGTQVWVAAGDYLEVETNGGASLDMKPGVQVYGGFAGTETLLADRDFTANLTRLVGTKDSSGDNVPVASVVLGDTGAVLDGFTITGGRAARGAGMFNDGRAPIVRNCIFIDNKALLVPALNGEGQPTGLETGGIGGGMLNFDDATPTIESCTFTNNEAEFGGGGLYNGVRSNANISNCLIENNRARLGGGIHNSGSAGRFDACIIQGNTALRLRLQDEAQPVVGAGFYNVGRLPEQSEDPLLADPFLINCLIADNTCISGTGGGFFSGEGLGRLFNCTIANNTAANGGGIFTFDGAQLTLLNTIVHGNTGGAIFDSPDFSFIGTPPNPLPPVALTTAGYSNIEGGWPGTQNLNVAPAFTAPGAGDYRLTQDSPLLDAGFGLFGPEFGSVSNDFEGDPRPFNGTVTPRGDGSDYDIGYDEYDGSFIPGEGEGEGTEEGEGSFEGLVEGDVQADVVYVNVGGTGSFIDGLSWGTALRTIEQGFLVAEISGASEIWVAAGTYAEERSGLGGSLQLEPGVALYGGFSGGETLRTQRDPQANPTIISGATANDGQPATSVVRAASDTRLDGFTLSGGRGTVGGGVFADGGTTPIANVLIENCIFTDNTATVSGGGLMALGNVSITLRNSSFAGNGGAVSGGGATLQGAIATFDGCAFTENTAPSGGGLFTLDANVLVTNCAFNANTADSGGGLSNLNTQGEINNTLFDGNQATSFGGGAFNNGRSPEYKSCQFYDNTSGASGGGLSNAGNPNGGASELSAPVVINSIFAGNTAAQFGGGIFSNGASPTVSNCTIFGNSATNNGGGIAETTSSGTYTNCIIWQNAAALGLLSIDSETTVQSCNTQDGRAGSNISANPRLVAPGARDFHLQSNSPCIDRGTDSSPGTLGSVVQDFEGDARPFSTAYDIGADEFTGDITPEGEGAEEGGVEGEGEGTSEGAEEGAVEGEGAAEGTTEGEGSAEGEPGSGDVIFVDIDNASGEEDGLTWGTAHTTLRAGLDAARNVGAGEVWVAEGVYGEARPGGGTLLLRSGIALYGGFAGTETLRTQRNLAVNETIIDGSTSDLGGPTERVLEGANNARIDGFTITGGRGSSGAGMLNFNVSPTVANCIFTNNEATDFGGAIFNLGGAAPLIRNCVFETNTAGASGGAITSLESAPTLVDCTFRDNTSNFGGAVFNNLANGEIIGCLFDANNATQSAGALTVLDSSPAIIECVFTGNTATDTAGAIFINVGSARIEDCRFYDNASGGSGGAVYTLGPSTGKGIAGDTSPFIVNSIFQGNRAVGLGGAIFNNSSTPNIVNCTLYDNLATDEGGGISSFESSPVITNTILWANSGTAIHLIAGTATVTYSIVQGGFAGTGNTDSDPLLIDPAGRDFRPGVSSPAVDAGRRTSTSGFGNVVDDIEGKPRGINGRTGTRGDGSDYDIGAHEFGTADGGEGEEEGAAEGSNEGDTEGSSEGAVEGDNEGAFEGEGEQPGCDVGNVEITAPANEAIILVGNGVSPLPLGLSARTNCDADTSIVQYSIDGSVVGGAQLPPYGFTIEDITVLSAGQHTVSAEAFGENGSVEDAALFSLLAAPANADANGNGYPDQATSVLLEDGDIWASKPKVPETGEDRIVRVDRFDRNPTNGGVPVVSVLSHPALPGVLVTIEVDRRVLDDGSIGLLVVVVAPDLATLLGETEAEQLTPQPEAGLTPGALYVAAGVLVSTDGGLTFSRLDPARLQQVPAILTMEGIQFTPDDTGIFNHPSNLRNGGSGGLRIESVFDGGWSDDAVRDITIAPDRLEALLTGLDIFAPFNLRPGVASLQVSPAQYTFGRVEVGQEATAVFTATNTGDSLLSGTATVAAPFRIISGGNYTLQPGASANITVGFTPATEIDYTAEVTFTGGAGATRTVTGTGIIPKVANFLGCASGQGNAGGWLSDVVLLLLVGAVLVYARRRTA